MNYRHAFHAGNFADVVKHLTLVAILLHLRRKDAPFVVIDTHAGRGAYDLKAEDAARTGEWMNGIGRLALLEGDGALAEYLKLARNKDIYPGSPLIAASLLRLQDRLIAIEKHPEETALLTSALGYFPRAKVEEDDGYRRLAALLPPAERRGVVLIDPPYEAADEFLAAAEALRAGLKRFATGIYLLWFPIKSKAQADAFAGEVLNAGAQKALRIDIDLGASPPTPDGKDRLRAAGLIVVNPPFGLAAEMEALLKRVAPLLSENAIAGVRWIAGAE
ncbi:MAG TPA: 23S rRNA (adenine(2030)-N(6))-methyltransferase RlmJ [Rhizomicrobium sp.]|nr:23S rRNA (adenine(2030)-N(6))-methyltransferase RlmJ [Rhizomicrobium sp.]